MGHTWAMAAAVQDASQIRVNFLILARPWTLRVQYNRSLGTPIHGDGSVKSKKS